jgi:pimeloyl-ACP methyl ester carboxylesterase
MTLRFVIGLVLILALSVAAWAEVKNLTIVARVPEGSGEVFVTGDIPAMGPWKPSAIRMTGEGRERRAVIAVEDGVTVNFVFTQGTWIRKGVDATGKEQPAFKVVVKGDTVVNVEVPAFRKPSAQELKEEAVKFVPREASGRKFLVYTPARLAAKNPVILFLHGSGERGDDNAIQAANGVRTLIAQQGDRFPFVVVVPQCPSGVSWTDPAVMATTFAQLDQAMAEFHGDPDRVVLTGLSLGGNGTWALAAAQPDRFAALVPCCGFVARTARGYQGAGDYQKPDPFYETALKVAHLPVWAFHGGDDDVVPPAQTRIMIGLLISLGKKPLYTEFPGVNHGSWVKAYAEPGLIPWMLKQKRR